MIKKEAREILGKHNVYEIINALMKEQKINEHNKSDVINHICLRCVE